MLNRFLAEKVMGKTEVRDWMLLSDTTFLIDYMGNVIIYKHHHSEVWNPQTSDADFMGLVRAAWKKKSFMIDLDEAGTGAISCAPFGAEFLQEEAEEITKYDIRSAGCLAIARAFGYEEG